LGDIKEVVEVVPATFKDQLPNEVNFLAIFEKSDARLLFKVQHALTQVLLFQVILLIFNNKSILPAQAG